MKSFSYAELDTISGELLPERAVLSVLMGGGNSFNNNNDDRFSGGSGSTTVVNACQSNITHPDDGLLQLVGLHAQHDAASFTCEPGTAAAGS